MQFNTGQLGCQFGDAGRGFDPGYLACLVSHVSDALPCLPRAGACVCLLMTDLAGSHVSQTCARVHMLRVYQERARRQFISATAITSFIACFLMGVVANMPLAVAPGMGVNAFFVYTVVGFFGTGGLVRG